MIRGSAPDGLVFEFRRRGENEPHRVLTTVPLRYELLDAADTDDEDVPRGTDADSGGGRIQPTWDVESIPTMTTE